MKSFAIEHIGISVTDPLNMAEWYRRVLGFKIMFSGSDESKAVAFVSDAEEHTTLELGQLPGITPLSEQIAHPLQLHIALRSADIDADAAYLVQNGAAFIEECPLKLPGDKLVILRDPWGNTIQLADRAG